MPSASEVLGISKGSIGTLGFSAKEIKEQVKKPVPKFATRKEQVQAKLPDVDIETGGPSQVRADLSFLRGEDVNRFLDESFGPGGHRETEEGTVVRITNEQGEEKEVLLDEFGLSLKDFSDLKGTLPEIAGSLVAGVALAMTAEVSLPVMAIVTAVAGQTTGAASDVITALGPVNMEKAKEIAIHRGQAAAQDFVFGIVGGKIAGVASRKARKLDTEDTITPGSVEDAATRLKERTGVEVPLTAAEVTGSPTLARVESIGEKLPLSSETFARQAVRKEVALKQVQKKLGGVNEAKAGRTATKELNVASDLAKQEIAEQTAKAEGKIIGEFERVGDLLGKGGKNLTASDGGESVR